RYPGSHRTHPVVRARRAQPFDRVSRPCSSSLYVTDGALLDALLGIGIHHNAVNVDTGQVDLVRIESAGLNDLFHFDHGDLAGHGDVRIEVAGRATEQQVAGAVGLPGFHQRDIRHERALHDVGFSVEFAGFFAFGHERTHARLCEEGRNAGAAGAQL